VAQVASPASAATGSSPPPLATAASTRGTVPKASWRAGG
jgi:hypothetical protein